MLKGTRPIRSSSLFLAMALAAFVAAACAETTVDAPAPKTPSAVKSASPAKTPPATKAVEKAKAPDVAPAKVAPAPKAEAATLGPQETFDAMRALVASGKTRELSPFFTTVMKKKFPRIRESDAKTFFGAGVTYSKPKLNGGVAVFDRKAKGRPFAAVLFKEGKSWRFDLEISMKYKQANRGAKHPLNKAIDLVEALNGIPGIGDTLYSIITTNRGEFKCRMLTKAAPLTVANFVGLARGLRGYLDVKTKAWTKGKFYDGLVFHRVLPRFMIQGGCPLGSGTSGPGYNIPDEFEDGLVFDSPGLLAMANSGPNTNGSQFFITEVPTAWLNYRHTIFGVCEPAGLVQKIAAMGTKPPTTIESISFLRE